MSLSLRHHEGKSGEVATMMRKFPWTKKEHLRVQTLSIVLSWCIGVESQSHILPARHAEDFP